MLMYGKDNTSAGLRQLDSIIENIRTEEFAPDTPRAGMFRNPRTDPGHVDGANDVDPFRIAPLFFVIEPRQLG